ncbi:MAG: hypothetical protein ACRDHN_14940 [Thermomicrobiales bacterium]
MRTLSLQASPFANASPSGSPAATPMPSDAQATPIVYIVNAEATLREWVATGVDGALVTLDGSFSSENLVTYRWFECLNEACTQRVDVSDGTDPFFRVTQQWLNVGPHRLVLEAQTPDNVYILSDPIIVTVDEAPTPTPPPTSTPTPLPTSTPTPMPTSTPTPAPTLTPTPLPTSTPVPTATPTPVPTLTPTPLPTATPAPTLTPTPVPTLTPTPVPTSTPTPLPTSTPTPEPTLSPTPMPTLTPTPVPTSAPQPIPTSTPTPSPVPAASPTLNPPNTPFAVSAEATKLDWIASGPQGAYVQLDGSESTPGMAGYTWYTCANDDCSLRTHITEGYDPAFITFSVWMPIGKHEVLLVALTNPGGAYLSSSIIEITVTAP